MHKKKIISYFLKVSVFKKTYYHKFFLLLIFSLISVSGYSQIKTIGTPSIHNYPKSVYQAATQNWGITQDQSGFIYFANNDGVLRFDGIHWDLIKVSKSSPVRSVFADSNNTIYVGLINDFGIISQNDPKFPVFQSLKNLLPAQITDFDDIWRIHQIPEGIVFQCYDFVFILNEGNIKVVEPQEKFHFSFCVNNRLFLHETGTGLFEYKNGETKKLNWFEPLKNNEISAVLSAGTNQLLVGTAGNGLFITNEEYLEKWNTPASNLVEENKLYSATGIMDRYIVFGTILNGLVVSDFEGNIVQQISREHGLQNNTILSVFADNADNLWLGLDNGIDYVQLNSPVSFITDFERLGTGYCSRIFDGNLYLGTNQGLFVRPYSKFPHTNDPFELVQNTAGQVWSLEEFDGKLICGHNLGTFLINGKNASLIHSEEGAWKYIRLKDHPDLLLGGHYSGLVLLKKENDQWTFHKKLTGFNESSRYIRQSENGNVWISHGGKGVFRIILSQDADSITQFKMYTSENGLPSNESNILFELNNRIYISTIAGIYEYNSETDNFIESEETNRFFTLEGRIKTLEPDNSGSLWYIAENESGVMRLNEDFTYTKITSPFKQLEDRYVTEFEFIYPYPENDVIIGIDNGFAHYTSEFPKSYIQTFPSYITRVEIPYMDSILYFNRTKNDFQFDFPFRKNTFRFHFTATWFENAGKLEFSHFLENYSEEWSEWSSESYKDFTNLFEGEYTFMLKARNIYEVESETASFEFTIVPPWHRSQTAYYLYLGFFLFLSFLTFRFIHQRIELSRKKERQKHMAELQKKEELFQKQALIAEKEIIKLRNEKLQNEMTHRDKELANQTMGIIQKNKFLMKLKEELQTLQKTTDDSQIKTRMATLNKKINKEIDNKQQNQIFETYFDEVHDEFFNRLKQKNQQLSPRDLRLCAYIRMNLTSKEIAALLNISERGVEISRYRLRKKMDLPREANLSTFLSNI